MITRRLTIDPTAPDPATIARAAGVLRAGGLVAFPTETVYGLGASAMDATALRRIFTAKQRPTSDPIIAHIADPAQLDLLAREVPTEARQLARHFWPGPLTLILRRAAGVPGLIAEGLDTIAVRMPAHPVARALIEAAGVPVGAPSANTFTRPSATTADHVLEDLDGRIDLLLDGGPAPIGLESTVVDLTSERTRVLRPGGTPLEALRDLIPCIELAPSYAQHATATASPGQLLKHYSPNAQVLLYRGEESAVVARLQGAIADLQARGRSVGALVVDEDAGHVTAADHIGRLGSAQDLALVARNLFAALRELDRRGVDTIIVRDFGAAGLGAALSDRLLRAAEGAVVDC
jgi:L-threonylcarbamoyladenylate synthase